MVCRNSPIPHVSLYRRPGRRNWYAHVQCRELDIDYAKPVCLDRTIAREWAVKTSQDITRQRLGIITPLEFRRAQEARKPIFELVDKFTEVRSTPKITVKEVKQVDARCRRILESMEASALSDLIPDRVTLAIAALYDEGLSLQTCNEYLKAVKRFAIYLERATGFHNEIRWIKPYPSTTEIVHPRRSPAAEEVERLLIATRLGIPYEWYSCVTTAEERELCYLLAANTGIRYSELRFLFPEDFKIGELQAPLFSTEERPPAVRIRASRSKNRKIGLQPLPPDIAARFAEFIRGKKRGEPIWTLPDKAYLMLKFDQAAADPPIEYKTDEGYFDFHSLRHFYGTELGKRERNIKTVQGLMRHSDVRLTLRYMHVSLHDEVAAVGRLPNLTARLPKRRIAATRPDPQLSLFATGATPAEGTAGKSRLTADLTALSQTHLSGVEPETFGSVDRRSIQLS